MAGLAGASWPSVFAPCLLGRGAPRPRPLGLQVPVPFRPFFYGHLKVEQDLGGLPFQAMSSIFYGQPEQEGQVRTVQRAKPIGPRANIHLLLLIDFCF